MTRTAAPVEARRATLVPWVLAAAAIGCQIAFPLTGGGTRALTIATVVVFAAASVSHVAVTRGLGAAGALVAIAGGGGLLAEAVGVSTGVPFGEYAYAGTLGPQVLGVPIVVALAWTMMAWPALVVARRLVPSGDAGARVARIAVGAWALASWDVFLDPQMIDAGHWTWADPTPALPGVAGVPLSNFGGWLLVAAVLIAALDAALPARPGPDGVPAVLYAWTYTSSVLAAAAFFGRPTVALVGGVVMGVVAVPFLVSLWRGRSR